MKNLLLKYALFFFVLPFSQAQNVFQLAPPYLRYESVFFEKSATVKLEFAQSGTKIHYTTNGQEPTNRDPVYTKPIQVKKNLTTLKAKVFEAGFLPSEVVEATFYKQGLAIESISTTLPHERYPGSGKTALIDGKGGNKILGSNTWMGFQTDTVLLKATFANPQKVKQVMLHVLQNQGAWIFLPQKIEVHGAINGSNSWVLLGQKSFEPSKKAEKDQCRAIFIDLKECPKTTQIILKVYPLATLPDWHPGKGNAAWLFMDEVKLY